MGLSDKSDKPLSVEKLATDGSNWFLWQATLYIYFKSRNLLKHIEGTADRPPDPLTFSKGHILSDDREAKVNKTEEILGKYLGREGLVKI